MVLFRCRNPHPFLAVILGLGAFLFGALWIVLAAVAVPRLVRESHGMLSGREPYMFLESISVGILLILLGWRTSHGHGWSYPALAFPSFVFGAFQIIGAIGMGFGGNTAGFVFNLVMGMMMTVPLASLALPRKS